MANGQDASTTSQALTPTLGGVVTSPNYTGNYAPDIDKTFTIEGSTGKFLQIDIVDIDIESSYGKDNIDYPSCEYDWLQVTPKIILYVIQHSPKEPSDLEPFV